MGQEHIIKSLESALSEMRGRAEQAGRVPCRGCNGADTAKASGAECYNCRNKPYWELEGARDEITSLRAKVEELEARAASLNTPEFMDKVAVAVGCPQWDYPGQLLRDIEYIKQHGTDMAERALVAEAKVERLEGELAEEKLSKVVGFYEEEYPQYADKWTHELQEPVTAEVLNALIEKHKGLRQERDIHQKANQDLFDRLSSTSALIGRVREKLEEHRICAPSDCTLYLEMKDLLDCADLAREGK